MNEYEHYEQLLLERDRTEKAAGAAARDYICTLGEPLRVLHELRFEIVRLKKSVTFCQRARMRGLPIDLNAMEEFLACQLAPHTKRLNLILSGIESAQKTAPVGEYTILRVQQLYRKLAKQLHPELHPAFAENEEVLDLWTRITDAYQGNDLTALQELEVFASCLPESLGEDADDPEIDGLDERIEQLECIIEQIRSTDPYLYRELLCDPEAMQEKIDTLNEDLERYTAERDRLSARLRELTLKGDTIWKVTLD